MLRNSGSLAKFLTAVLAACLAVGATACADVDVGDGALVPAAAEPVDPTVAPIEPTPPPTAIERATPTPEPTATAVPVVPLLPDFELAEETAAANTLLKRLPDLTGEVIEVVAPDVGGEGLRAALAVFAKATGATVELETDPNPSGVVARALEAGTTPDVAVVSQPGRVRELADEGLVQPIPASIVEVVEADFGPVWSELVSDNGRMYGVPNNATVKSLVWYRPADFARLGYEVPTTWAELEALQVQMRSDGRVPWCIGNASASGGGWPFTDWVEDMMLRMYGPDVYDQWISHSIGFDDPRVVAAIEAVGEIWFEPGNVFGGRATVAATSWRDAGLPLLNGACLLHRQAGFYADNYVNAGATLGRAGQVAAFYLPPMSDKFGSPVIGEGDWFAAFTDRPATWALMRYLASPRYANARIRSGGGGFLSPNRTHATGLYDSEVDTLMADLLVSNEPFRFDASALMPPVVGSDEFWRAGSAYVWGEIDVGELVGRVQAAWPE